MLEKKSVKFYRACYQITPKKKVRLTDFKSIIIIGEDDVYDTSELAEELKLDWEILLNTSSGGAIRCSEIVFSKDVSDKEFDMELDFEEDNEKITLREACETWNDEILSYNDWSEGTVTYYKSPLKVVEVKD